MGLFTKKKTDEPDYSAITSIIGSDMNILGDVVYDGKVRVDGTITGNVKGEHFILGEEGKIVGDIEAHSFICHGKIEGNLKGKEVFIRKAAVIKGGITADILHVEGGAYIQGPIQCGTSRNASDEELQSEEIS